MARVAIDVTTAATNSQASQTTTVSTAGATGTLGLYIPATADVDEKFVLNIRETQDGDTGAVYIKAADSTDGAPNYGQGDQEILVGGLANIIAGPFERARFGQSDGTINVDVCGVTGIFSVVDLSL